MAGGCRMFKHAILGLSILRYLSSDNVPLYRFQQWQANLRVLSVAEVKRVSYVPMSVRSFPFVERSEGSGFFGPVSE